MIRANRTEGHSLCDLPRTTEHRDTRLGHEEVVTAGGTEDEEAPTETSCNSEICARWIATILGLAPAPAPATMDTWRPSRPDAGMIGGLYLHMVRSLWLDIASVSANSSQTATG